MRKAIAALLSACMLIAMTAGTVHARALQEILDSGTIRVGVNPTLPPLGTFSEQNEIVGFDVDFSKRIAAMLGVELEIVRVQSTDRIPYVVSGEVDYVMGAMTRTPARAKVIDFTVPVHTEVFGVLTVGGRNDFNHWRDLNSPDITLIQVRGTTPIQFIEENLPKAELLLLDGYPAVVRALAQGRGDAVLDVVDFLGGFMENYDVDWKVLETPVEVYYCSLGIAQGNASLKNWLDVALWDLHESGFIDKIWKKWFGMPMIKEVPATPYF